MLDVRQITRFLNSRMGPDHSSKAIDWRERLHTLPSDPEPASPLFIWFSSIVTAIALFCLASFLSIMLGGIAGIYLGIGPEQTGGTLYVILGAIINIFIGAALAAFLVRRSRSRLGPRLVFYSFSAPAFLVVIFIAYSALSQLLR